jgi:hypothetical protein
MATPVVTTLTSGNLGRVAANTDGTAGIIVTGVAVGGSFALGDVLGPFKTIQEVEAVGIDAAYDTTNSTNAYQHCKEFFEFANQFGGVNGTGLYIMVVADTVSMEDICDKTNAYAKTLLTTAAGAIKLLGITRVLDSGTTPSYTAELEDDLALAIAKLKELYTEEFSFHRPFQTLIEGMQWQGTVASTLDMRDASSGFTWEHGGVVLGQTGGMATLGATVTEVAESASVGAALGSMAACSVQESIGKVKKGMATSVAPYTSDGELVSALSDAQMSTLEDQGFIFLRPHVGKPGYYWSNDANACPLTSDYAYASRSRPIDKVVRLAYDVYIEDYQDDIELDAETGKMAPSVVKSFQERIKESVAGNMLVNSELSGFDAYCDPDQDVLSDDEVDVELRAVPKGRINQVSVTVGYTTSV